MKGMEKTSATGIREEIGKVMARHPIATLATVDPDRMRPHASLVGFAFSDDLRRILFATPKATRKYANLTKCPQVALLTDSRGGTNLPDIGSASAVTAFGACVESAVDSADPLVAIYLTRHPQLEEFLFSPSTAAFEIRVESYSLVRRFQEVSELRMDRKSE
jgi:hypothetical protein